MSIRVDRRNFVRFATGGALGTATSGISLRSISRLNEALANEEVVVPGGPETWSLSVCTLCPAACGLRVRKIGARAVSVQGNPLHPVNQGGLCPKGIASLQALYHPHRVPSPLKNVGSRKSPRWKQISWEEANSVLVSRLRELRESGRAHRAVLIDRSERNLLSRLLRRFMAAYGSPNYLVLPSGLDAIQTAVYLQQGVEQPVAYDLERTRYVLSFGVNLLEGWGSPTVVMRAFGRWRDSSSGRRTKLAQIEPRLSVTAARADEWVALRPGTEAALALGIAYVLIAEGLYDATFVRDHTFGFEDWRDAGGKNHIGFRSLVMGEYRLNDVASLTGVPEETILRLAREFGNNRPALALGDHQTSNLPGDPYAAMAVHSLNALVGSIDVPGGVLVQPELPVPEEALPSAGQRSWPRIDQTADHLFPGHHLSRLPQAILSGQPYPVEALLLNNVDPVFSMPNPEALREAFSKVPFIVCFTSFPGDTSNMADLVLPAPTDLERWQEATSSPLFPHVMQSLSSPAVAPRHQARHPADVILEVARSLGKPVAESLPFSNFEEYLRSQVTRLFSAQSGSVFSTSLEEAWTRLLERSGWWAPTYSTAEELWEQMQQQGGWWDPAYHYGEWDQAFHTSSRRFEFYSQALAQWAANHPKFADGARLEPGDDRLFLPHQPPVAKSPPEYPYLLLPIETLPLAGGHGAHLPYLQQIAGPHLFAAWQSWLEIHPETAHKLSIKDGDTVWLESRRGRVQVRARFYVGVRPDVVHLPLGYGHTTGSVWGRRGVNPLSLLEEHYDPVAGLPQVTKTYVKLYRT